MARLTALVCAALLVTAAGSGAARAPTGNGFVVFSVFDGLPAFDGDDRCEGLYASRADGGGLRRLTAPDVRTFEGHFWPSFAPNGRLLVFGFAARRDPRDLGARLFELEPERGRTRALGTSDLLGAPAWSPRGDAILVYRLHRRAHHLARLDVRTRRTTALVSPRLPVAMLSPSWSPDGSRIAFTARGAGRDTIWVIGADGTGRRRLGPRGAAEATWSPDGRRIAFLRSAGAATDLWTIRPNGSGARRLARGVLNRGSHSVVWSPGGSSLLFLREPPPRPYYPGSEHEVGDLYRLDLGTGRARLVTRKVIPVSWADDGRLLLLRPRTAFGELVYAVVVRTRGRERIGEVTDEEDVNIGSYPAWQPRRFAFRAARPPFAPQERWGFCLDRLRALRRELSG